MEENIFQTCPCCFFTWSSRQLFLSDHNLELIGYEFNPDDLERGLFFFAHKAESCNSIMSLTMGDFRDLYSGKIYKENKALTEGCPRYCVDKTQLSRCNELCGCAFVREIFQIILEKQKEAG
jgi:hypothetical protein